MEKGAQINGAMVHSAATPPSASDTTTRLGKRVKPENEVAPQELAAS